MNAPERFELVVLPEEKKKIEEVEDQKIQSASTFVLEREDHTIGNLMRMQLLRDPEVLFAGYKIPHPLEYKCLIKVQTKDSQTPEQAFQRSLEDLKAEFSDIQSQFKNAVKNMQSNEFY